MGNSSASAGGATNGHKAAAEATGGVEEESKGDGQSTKVVNAVSGESAAQARNNHKNGGESVSMQSLTVRQELTKQHKAAAQR